jgi:PTH1 family peptidyl-tRNA hydrolase
VRAGVGRPDSSDSEIVSAHVLGAFREPKADVADLVDRAAAAAEAMVLASASPRSFRRSRRVPMTGV